MFSGMNDCILCINGQNIILAPSMHALTQNTSVFVKSHPDSPCDRNPCESFEVCNDFVSANLADSKYQCKCANGEEICVEDLNCTIEYGPYGGNGGSEFSDYSLKEDGFITEIHMRIGNGYAGMTGYSDCIGMTYGNMPGTCHGLGMPSTVLLEKGEYITAVSGRIYDEFPAISQMNFTTNFRTLGPYGNRTLSGNSEFNVDSEGKKLAFISGSNGGMIDQLSFHFYC